MALKSDQLPPELVEKILMKLGLSEVPTVDFSGLSRLYQAWCRRVPFDNIRKRIHLAAADPRPLPGHDDTEFFHGWLQFGLGGTCWAGSGALYALLDALGFACERGTATMLPDACRQPDHGTVFVHCEGKQYLVDASMLHGNPLPLRLNQSSSIDHPAWGLTCTPLKQLWAIHWRPLHMLHGCTCRILESSIDRETFRRLNETSRKQSPFNHALYIRLNTAESVIGISASMSVDFSSTGQIIMTPLSHESRLKLLVEKMGISEEILAKLPADR